jgi:putative MFS transporter
VAACTKGGGLAAQSLTISGVLLSMGLSAALIMIPTTLALVLVAWFGRETRGSDLRDLDADSGQMGHAEFA